MNSAIFIPKTIKVGFNERSDTYTGKLAYVIYYDAKNKLRKERSWQSWRDTKIDPVDFTNEPTSGFVLNKKVGGTRYDWNPRQTYTRVYDPRGFEFEITIPNLLYILENANSIKGKGLEGDFVYGWDGTELVLIPVEAPEYVALANYADILANPEKITAKNIILGATYKTNKNENWIYLGRFPYYDKSGSKEKFIFVEESNNKLHRETPTLSKKIVQCINPTPVSNYAELMDELEYKSFYSPITSSVFVEEAFPIEKANDQWFRHKAFILFNNKYVPVEISSYYHGRASISVDKYSYVLNNDGQLTYYCYVEDHQYIRNISDELDKIIETAGATTLLAVAKIFTFYKQVFYLKNGKEYKGGGYY